jgi:hypothetical protein
MKRIEVYFGKRKRIFYSLVIAAIILFAFAFSLSINSASQERLQISSQGVSLTASPSILYLPSFLGYNPSVLVKIMLPSSLVDIPVVVYELSPEALLVYKNTFHNASFFYFYFQTHYIRGAEIESYSLDIANKTIIFSLEVKNSILPLLGESSLILSFAFFIVGVYFSPFRSKYWPILIMIGYVLLLPFFGQRYDMFFMISGGFHVLSGVNPFTSSAVLNGALKWAYPPYYLFWSPVSDWLSGLFTRTPIPSSSSLIYPGVLFGNIYDAWQAFVPASVPVYYALAKVPMLVSVVLIYYVLDKKFGLNHNLTKIWLLSPLVIIVGVVWGQLDVIASLSLLVSIYFFQKERTDLAVLSATLGFWVKIFPAFMLPFVLIQSKNKVRDTLVIVAASIPALIFYYLSGNFTGDISTLLYSRSIPTFHGIFDSQGLTWQTIIRDLGVTHFPPIFTYSILPFLIIISVIYYYRRGNIVNYVIAEFLFYFLSYNFVNPQYFIILVPLFLLNDDVRNYVAYSIYPLIFIAFSYTFPYWIVPSLSLNYFSSVVGQVESARIWMTGSNVFIFPLIIMFTASLGVTGAELILGRRIVFRKKSPSLP